ncbi:MAG: hypothetical protein RMJ98_22375, partial [Myxococcales bacterium]|nr:hypothetical protein [Myxococcales bacterium]
ALRRAHRPSRPARRLAPAQGGGLLGLGGATAAYARYLRLEVGLGVVVVEEARVVDERGVPTTQPSLPEAARVDILERKGGLLRVRWGEVSGYTGAQNVRIVGPHKP